MVAEKVRTNIYIDSTIKTNAKKVFDKYGLSLSQAINIFLTQSVFSRGMPFEMRIPNDETLEAMRDLEHDINYEEITLEELDS